MAFIETVRLFTDGGARGNPGPGAIGVLILRAEVDEELDSHAECIGHTTNNRAEYRALIKGLNLCAKHTRREVSCFLDSELVVKHLSEVYRLKDDELRELFLEVKRVEQVFRRVTYTHVPRTNPFIQRVDRLVNEALDGR